MTATIADKLSAHFVDGEVLQFTKTWRGKDGRDHSMSFDYIEDETVMDRLDEVLGVGAWSVSVEAVSVADGIVKVTLEAIVEGKGVQFQDFGYATRADGEQLKEAVSDGIRRCGRFLGVGRYLYHKRQDPSSSGASQSTGRGSPQSRPAARPTDDEPEFAPNEWEAVSGGGECPTHRKPWRNGQYGWFCASKAAPGERANKRGYCDERPTREWVEAHAA